MDRCKNCGHHEAPYWLTHRGALIAICGDCWRKLRQPVAR